jgi:hypothetical protein
MSKQLPTEIDVTALGLAMQALTPHRRGFVLAKVYGGMNDKDACLAAGYARTVAEHQQHTISGREDVQAAILEEGRKLMRREGPRSILTLVAIRDSDAKPADRIKAATELLNRSGFHAVSEHHDHQHVHQSEAELDRRILALAAELGMTPEQAKLMLIAPADMERNAEGVFELAPPAPRELSTDPRAVGQRAARARRKNMTPEEVAADKQRVENERVDRLRRERAEHEARRNGETITEPETEPKDPWASVEY